MYLKCVLNVFLSVSYSWNISTTTTSKLFKMYPSCSIEIMRNILFLYLDLDPAKCKIQSCLKYISEYVHIILHNISIVYFEVPSEHCINRFEIYWLCHECIVLVSLLQSLPNSIVLPYLFFFSCLF